MKFYLSGPKPWWQVAVVVVWQRFTEPLHSVYGGLFTRTLHSHTERLEPFDTRGMSEAELRARVQAVRQRWQLEREQRWRRAGREPPDDEG